MQTSSGRNQRQGRGKSRAQVAGLARRRRSLLAERGAKIVLGAHGLDRLKALATLLGSESVITQRMRQSLLMLDDTVKR